MKSIYQRNKLSTRCSLNINRFYMIVLFSSLTLFNPVSSSASFRQTEKKILDNIIGHQYDSRIRPSGYSSSINGSIEDGPCIVRVNIFVRSISEINDVTMEYATQITFREEWGDSRLTFDDMNGRIKFLTLTDPEKIWKPDLFFSNEKTGHTHEIIMPNVLLRIYPNGDVLFSIRISLVLFCPMHLKYFPLDSQTCTIKMASYGYTTADLVFLWKAIDPVQITKKLNLPRFTLMKFSTEYCTSRTNTGEYSCLEVSLIFKREFSYYLILIYVPCCMLVIVSWVSFWIDPNSAAARVALGVTSLLTMSRQISGINASLPPVSYTKAVDVWTGCCLTFVFSALIEFAVVNYVSRQDAHKVDRRRRQPNRHLRIRSKKWESSGKDSGIESEDFESEGPIDYAKALGATKIGGRGRLPSDPRIPNQNRSGNRIGNGRGMMGNSGIPNLNGPKRNFVKKMNFISTWLSRFPTRSKRIDVISRISFPLLFALFNIFYWTTYLMRKELQDLEN